MMSQDPVTSKSHTFQDHHGDVRSRLRARRDRVPRGRTVSCFLAFSDCSPAFSCLTVSFFLSLRLRGFSFLFLSHFSFCLCSCTGINDFRSVVGGFSISQPPFPSSQYVIPSENTHAWRVLTAGWFLRHMYSLTKWKCDTDAVMSECNRPTVASLLSRWLRCWRAASQQLINPATLADAKLESTLTNENNMKLRYLIADLNSHVKLALPCELTKAKSPCACRLASTSNIWHKENSEKRPNKNFPLQKHFASTKNFKGQKQHLRNGVWTSNHTKVKFI